MTAVTDGMVPGTLVEELLAGVDRSRVLTGEDELRAYSRDQGPVAQPVEPAAVVLAESIEEVQHVVRSAHRLGVPLIARGAGTSLSGGAHAVAGCIVLSLERMNRILEVRPEDELAMVEPGVINADLNIAVAPYGLMYAPDPASHTISTLGGNVATNAGGLRCAKYGVTRDSVLALDVVLADGTLIHTGHSTFKGVAGYDLTALFVGSEGTLGVVVGITVRLKYLPVETRTLAAFFPDIPAAAAGVLAIGAARVQPAILELLDGNTLGILDTAFNSNLAARGGALLLVQTDGFGAEPEAAVVRDVLTRRGATVEAEEGTEAAMLLDLRRNARGDGVDDDFRVGEDVAVPRSQLVHYAAELERMAGDHQVRLRLVAHAGDGNLHPTFWVSSDEGADGVRRLHAALDESVRVALALGGTITGEHGIGQYKLRWLSWEQSAEVLVLQRRIKEAFDPRGILNPGKAIL
ncbi:FAD-binding oxidoreductase [uncultured Arthrobacter sp.]|uniref:FAD-binding oxidoreductase n=1 Tax=uncultured Arthrobacter sp. TaxID=114050 RepID=UPI002615B2DA|nr:FAD-linked oxidase C-terminal domain-containing protein [uncultured Arthrobacter sp.]